MCLFTLAAEGAEQPLQPGLALRVATGCQPWDNVRGAGSCGKGSVVSRKVLRWQENGYPILMTLGLGEPEAKA